MGTLSRGEMEAAIAEGGSVLYGGHLISRVQDLPSAADLARGNPEQEAAAAAALEAQIAALQAQRAQLGQAAPTSQSGAAPTTEHPFVTVVGEEQADRLVLAGYETPDAVKSASDEELLAVEGVGQATLRKLRAAYGKG
jgi:hypothetical protein